MAEKQQIIYADDAYASLEKWILDTNAEAVLLVADASLPFLKVREFFDYWEVEERKPRLVRFSDFQPNPLYESVLEGVKVFREEQCGAVIAVGGGSAMDVAKCIMLYAGLPGDGEDGSFLKTELPDSTVPFLALPTTAGTGSEATRFAVIYYQGAKQSVASYSCIPGTVLFDPSCLKTLPLYQKKSTMADALCHAIESYWSVNSTEESRRYSAEAIRAVLAHLDGYLENTDEGNAGMLSAAHTAGQAINITQTTAGHAMCYKLTSLFGAAHGHAALLCDRVLFPHMIRHTADCIDPRGEAYLKATLDEIGQALGEKDAEGGAEKLEALFTRLELPVPALDEEKLAELVRSVNPVRLKNHPIGLSEDMIEQLYRQILK